MRATPPLSTFPQILQGSHLTAFKILSLVVVRPSFGPLAEPATNRKQIAHISLNCSPPNHLLEIHSLPILSQFLQI